MLTPHDMAALHKNIADLATAAFPPSFFAFTGPTVASGKDVLLPALQQDLALRLCRGALATCDHVRHVKIEHILRSGVLHTDPGPLPTDDDGEAISDVDDDDGPKKKSKRGSAPFDRLIVALLRPNGKIIDADAVALLRDSIIARSRRVCVLVRRLVNTLGESRRASSRHVNAVCDILSEQAGWRSLLVEPLLQFANPASTHAKPTLQDLKLDLQNALSEVIRENEEDPMSNSPDNLYTQTLKHARDVIGLASPSIVTGTLYPIITHERSGSTQASRRLVETGDRFCKAANGVV
jgi:hypothetical protein